MNEFEVIKGGNHKETSESLDYTKQSSTDKDVLKFTEEIVLDKEIDLSRTQTVAMPIAELASLGGAAAALLPAFRTVHSTISVETGGLYRLANQAVGDTLKVAKNGNFWGAMKTQAGKSKFAQLQEVGTLSASQKTVMPINRATVMIAVAMYSIDQKLDQVMKMQKQILSFLEEEKQSQ